MPTSTVIGIQSSGFETSYL